MAAHRCGSHRRERHRERLRKLHVNTTQFDADGYVVWPYAIDEPGPAPQLTRDRSNDLVMLPGGRRAAPQVRQVLRGR